MVSFVVMQIAGATLTFSCPVYEQILSLVRSNLKEGEITLVAHRIVHGGDETAPIPIRHENREEASILARMDAVSAFAPLHSHHAMLVVKHTLSTLPNAVSVLCFDTLFHSSISTIKTTYPIPPSQDSPVPLRKYGFHGLSYASILRQMSGELKKSEDEIDLIVVHAGSGASCCLILKGQSVDTTMGLTPLEGLPGGTRSGSVDPSLIFHHTPNSSNLVTLSGSQKIARGELLLNKESGFKALTGTSDFGKIISRAFDDTTEGEEKDKARLCYDLFVDRVCAFVANYLSQAGGRVDGIVFSGGIGEKSDRFRADVMASAAGWIEQLSGKNGGIDARRNSEGEGRVREITKDGSYVRAYVVETDEEAECIKLALKHEK